MTLKHFNDANLSLSILMIWKMSKSWKKTRKALITFDNIFAHFISNKKSNSVVTELFTRDRKIYISLVFISPSYFKVPKDVKLNSTHYFILKISNKREFRQIAVDHPSDIDYKDFMKIFKKYIIKAYFS